MYRIGTQITQLGNAWNRLALTLGWWWGLIGEHFRMHPTSRSMDDSLWGHRMTSSDKSSKTVACPQSGQPSVNKEFAEWFEAMLERASVQGVHIDPLTGYEKVTFLFE